MTTKLTYKLITTVGEETANGNAAFKQLEQFVNKHVREGWTPIGGIAVSPVVGPKTVGSTRNSWFVRIAQPWFAKSRNDDSKHWSRHMQKQLTAFIEREGDGYVSLCPELDIASQGDTIAEARENLREALELFFETASPEEIQSRMHEEVYVTRLEVAVG